jgi:GrpB-like predicted nucleotidyltransferase (UPF0157 family)
MPVIVIDEYKPTWRGEFETIRASLSGVLPSLALRIDHIGSTSVPGLGAKDVIDVQITVRTLEPQIVHKLVAAGYHYLPDVTRDHLPPGEPDNPDLWAKLFFREPSGQRRAHIHVRIDGNPNQRYTLLFRDYLRAHPHSARTIEVIKRQLAKYHADDIDAYYEIKDPVYDLVWRAAQDWATETGWTVSAP